MIKKRVRRYREKGQGLIEYIMITGLVGMICLVALKLYGDVLQRRMEQIKAKVVQQMDFS